jgi:hypothetical protein
MATATTNEDCMNVSVHTDIYTGLSNITDFDLRTNTLKTLNLEPIKYKLVKEKGWTLEKADATETHYKAFLQLHLLYPKGMHVPTEDIDEMWHAHILDTGKYMIDCYSVFGHYLHHFPYLGMKDEANAEKAKVLFHQTRERMVATGMIDTTTPEGLAFADCGGGCSSSCSSSSCSGGHGDSGGGGHGDTVGDGGISGPSLPFPSCTTSSCSSSTPDRKRDEKKPKKDEGRSWWNPWRKPKPNAPVPRMALWINTVNPMTLDAGNRPGRMELEAMVNTMKVTGGYGAIH